MAKRRTKEDEAKNDIILGKLFDENTVDGKTAIITYQELVDSGYIGSLPYTTLTATPNYAIRQLSARGVTFPDYSILKLART